MLGFLILENFFRGWKLFIFLEMEARKITNATLINTREQEQSCVRFV